MSLFKQELYMDHCSYSTFRPNVFGYILHLDYKRCSDVLKENALNLDVQQ